MSISLYNYLNSKYFVLNYFLFLNPAADYDNVPQTVTVTFPAGTVTQTVSVQTTEDSLSEGPERFTATLSNPTGTDGFGIGPNNVATVNINDDDCT